MGLVSLAGEAQPQRQRWSDEQAVGGILGRERHRAFGPFDRLPSAQARRREEGAALGDRRGEPVVVGQLPPVPCAPEHPLRRLEIAREHRQVGEDAVTPGAIGETGLVGEPPRRGPVARVHRGLDRLERESLALGADRAQPARRDQARHGARPRAARHLGVRVRFEVVEQRAVDDGRGLHAMAHRRDLVADDLRRRGIERAASRRRQGVVDRGTGQRVRELDEPARPAVVQAHQAALRSRRRASPAGARPRRARPPRAPARARRGPRPPRPG